jgi:hypothetical protein
VLENKYPPKQVVFFMLINFFMLSCDTLIGEQQEEGERIARKYCSGCHQFPEPVLLNKTTWANYVLPRMGGLLGFQHLASGGYAEYKNDVKLPLEDWNKLVTYYISSSQKQLPSPVSATVITTELKNFTVETPASPMRRPSTTLVAASVTGSGFYFADGLSERLYQSDAAGKIIDSMVTGKGMVQIREDSSGIVCLSLGVLYPSDEKMGTLTAITKGRKQVILLDSLQRPVHASFRDLNNDGAEDMVIAEFGNRIGRLSWYEHRGGNKYTQHTLSAFPGAVKTIISDYNNDGKPDILSLMAQGNEGVFIYYNQGNGRFIQRQLIQLPPAYGCNSMEVADVNEDGFDDLIITNGDNGDYPPVLKPYHGIRIFLNDGKHEFSQKLFLHVNGVGKAIVKDFDQDGDQDIASIAYFPDFDNKPHEGFIFWENQGNLTFKAFTFQSVSEGRWLTMDAGDIDADGDIDIILGNAYFTLGYIPENFKKKWDAYSPSVILLKNNLKK